MKIATFKSSLIVLTLTLLFLLGPGTGQAQDEITIRGEDLPPEILDELKARFDDPNNPGVEEVQFRDLNLDGDEAAKLFLSPDLKALGDTLQDGQQVRFRGTVDGQRFEARVERNGGGLRARIEGLDVSGMTPEQLMSLAAENGFDRLRIRGTDGERFEFKRRDDGTLRAEFRGMDVSGYTPEQLMDLAKEKGLDRLRIRGTDGHRFEIKRKDDGTLRADFRGMEVGAYTPEQLTNLAKERGLDRLRIRGVDKDGNRVRIEYRQDKGIVKWEGAGRGVNEVSSRLNNKHGRDRGRDRENKLRDRVERGRERIDRGDHRFRGGKGRD